MSHYDQSPQPNNDPNLGLEFIVPFDGTQPEVESRDRELVASRFTALIEDTFLNNADQVNHFAQSTMPHDSILLDKQVTSDTKWTLAVDSQTEERPPNDEWESAEEIRGTVSIQKILNVSGGRQMVSYRLGSDGTVRRYDHGDAYEKMQAERAAGLGDIAMRVPRPGSSESVEVIESQIKNIFETVIPNDRLARKMGLNEQPISLEEMEGLEDFVRQPGFEVPPTLRRNRS